VGPVRGVAFDEFGGPEVLRVRDDLPEPPLGPDTVLVRTHAAGVNPVDLGIREGGLVGAFPHHFPIIPGWELSGVIEAAGPAVQDWSPGDEVVAYVRRDDVQWGATADLVPVPERCLGRKPSSLSFAEAAALPLAGLTAYQALTWFLDVGEGDRVLITRGAGGVGTFAIQIAVALGATVVTTASPRNEGYVRSLGAAEVIDHHAGRISEQLAEPVDALLDLVGGDAMHDAVKTVHENRPRGVRLASIVDPAIKEQHGSYVFVHPDGAGLGELATMADAGHLRVPIARAFPLEETAAAHEMVGEGHVRGKVVVTLR
jgi:NADPH:quinone reductase-like Zn-dependent oxidoreductase